MRQSPMVGHAEEIAEPAFWEMLERRSSGPETGFAEIMPISQADFGPAN